MAKIEKVYTNVRINLSLSEKEAQFLTELFYRVGGNQSLSRRVIADDLLGLLANVGIVPDLDDRERISGSINFPSES